MYACMYGEKASMQYLPIFSMLPGLDSSQVPLQNPWQGLYNITASGMKQEYCSSSTRVAYLSTQYYLWTHQIYFWTTQAMNAIVEDWI